MKCLNIISKLDFYGSRLTFRSNGSNKTKSVFGGVITILVFISFIYIFLNFSNKILSKKVYKTFDTEFINSKVKVSLLDLPIIFTMESIDGSEFLKPLDIFEGEIELVSVLENGRINIRNIENSLISFDEEQLNLYNYNELIKERYNKLKQTRNVLCFKASLFQNEFLELSNDFYYSYVNYNFKVCDKSNSKCDLNRISKLEETGFFITARYIDTNASYMGTKILERFEIMQSQHILINNP